MNIIFAILSVAAGLALIFWGYRLARILIPIWGFVTGLSIGGAVIANMQSTPFLGTVLGVIVGLILGIIFGVAAYLFYSIAVAILGASLGYWLGSSFMYLLGLNPGVLSALVGLALGLVFGIAVLVFNMPKYVLIVLSAAAGAVTVIGGILLLFNQIPVDAFSFQAAQIAVTNSVTWTIVAIALAIIGIVTQLRTTEHYDLEMWGMANDDSGHNIRPVAHPQH